MKLGLAVVVGLMGLLSACIPAFTDCTSREDCDQGYGCSPDDNRCHPSCQNGICDLGLTCKDKLCIEGAAAAGGSSSMSHASSHGSGSSSSHSSGQPITQGSSSSSGGVTSSMSSSSASVMGSSGPASSSSAGITADVCNGVDDDGDGSTDEDRWEVRGAPLVLSTESPPIRGAAAASDQGFFVAFSGYCLATSATSDVFVNHVGLDGSLAVMSGPCATITGIPAGPSDGVKSRHPALASQGGRNAGLVWSEGNETDAELLMVELRFVPGTLSPLLVTQPLSLGAVDTAYLDAGGDVEMYGGIAAVGGGYLTALTRGEGALEELLVQRVTRTGDDLVLAGSAASMGLSTGGEATLARAGDGFVAGWMDLNDSKGRFGTGLGATNGVTRSYEDTAMFPFEFAAVGLSSGAVVAWQEALVDDFFGIRRVSLALMPAASGMTRILRVDAPDARGSFGLAAGPGDELLLVTLDRTPQKPTLRQINAQTGSVCGTLTLESGMDVGHMAVAVSGRTALVIYRRGDDEPSASNSVEAVILERVAH